uniref:NADH-ubiquinone oxidoreductase chain 6 n=1 Tax=Choreutis emplecta TaxID=1555613 RepID=A0A6C0N8N8_9NEOP|nr:NADH dehydrogenase subunit 6 [Choreutis emplecta]
MDIKFIFSMILLSISFIMMFIKHPLSMGLLILLQTVFFCLLSGMMIKTYWFSYILFLTFMGGLLVLFIYLCSVASNDMFKYSMKLNLIILFFFITFTFMSLMFNDLNWMNMFINSEMLNFNNMNLFMNEENKLSLFKLYDNQIMLMLMLIIYLFVTLVAIVKITNIYLGPLRSSY